MGVSTNVKDVSPGKLVEAYAQQLKKSDIKLPKWVDLAKDGVRKELPATRSDWFYVRCASLARHIYLYPCSGVGVLRKRYGGSKNNGSKPEHKGLSSAAILRVSLQELEKIGIIKKHKNGGRIITAKGRKDLDRISAQVLSQ